MIATYHHGQVAPERFLSNVRQLRDRGCPAFVKLIARPGEDFADVPLWERVMAEGTPAAFAPFEDTVTRYSPEWLHAICTTYLTSTMYSARFFRSGEEIRLCHGGTRDSFQINLDGTIGRCSHVGKLLSWETESRIVERPGDLDAPNFFEEPAPCLPTHGCYCEPHHFSLMARAGENQRWERYITTGKWTKPSSRELIAFVRNEEWNIDGLRAALRKPNGVPRRSVPVAASTEPAVHA